VCWSAPQGATGALNAAAKPAAPPPKAPDNPGAKETVSLRIDRGVPDFFQEDDPRPPDLVA